MDAGDDGPAQGHVLSLRQGDVIVRGVGEAGRPLGLGLLRGLHEGENGFPFRQRIHQRAGSRLRPLRPLLLDHDAVAVIVDGQLHFL